VWALWFGWRFVSPKTKAKPQFERPVESLLILPFLVFAASNHVASAFSLLVGPQSIIHYFFIRREYLANHAKH
jgi:hypothetical protein